MTSWQDNVAGSTRTGAGGISVPNVAPQRFDVRGPTSLGAIAQLISGYGSPEAAEHDLWMNAPNGRDYIVNQYQRLSGDDSAKDMPSIFASMQKMFPADPSQPNIYTNAGRAAMGAADAAFRSAPWAQAPVDSKTGLTSDQNTYFANHPITSDPASIASRAAQVEGGGDLLRSITGTDDGQMGPPSPIGSGADSTDPDLIRKGKGLLPSDSLDFHIFSNPKFQQFRTLYPVLAAQFYKAKTNRNLQDDIAGHEALAASQESLRSSLTSELSKANITTDANGELMKKTLVPNPAGLGDYIEKMVPLSDQEKAILPRINSAFGTTYGVGGNKIKNTADGIAATIDPTQKADFDTAVAGYTAKGLALDEASKLAANDMYKAKNASAAAKISPIRNTGNPSSRGLLDELGDTALAQIGGMGNAVSSVINMLPGDHPLPLFEANKYLALKAKAKMDAAEVAAKGKPAASPTPDSWKGIGDPNMALGDFSSIPFSFH